MSERRADRRRANHRAFRPAVDGRLETRLVMSEGKWTFLYGAGHIQTAFGGQAVDITTNTGQSFYVVASVGQIRAYHMPGNRYGLKIFGSSNQTDVTINPVVDFRFPGSAHKQNTREPLYNSLLNIGAITVANGQIADIQGYKDTVLSGPLIVPGTTPIQRIALDQILPGASIITGGDLNTLDVYGGINLSGPGTGIFVGRDLNSLTANNSINVTNGAAIAVGRDLGLVAQPPIGTGPGGQGIFTFGNLNLTGGQIAVGQFASNIRATGPIIGFRNFAAAGLFPGSQIYSPSGVFY